VICASFEDDLRGRRDPFLAKEKAMTDEPAMAVPGTAPADRPTRASGRAIWAAALLAGLLATLLAWMAGEALVRRFSPESAPAERGPLEGGGVALAQINSAWAWIGTIVYAVQGSGLGLLLGAAGAIAGRRLRRAWAGVIGLILGGAWGAGLSAAIFPIFFRTVDLNSDDLLVPLFMHAAVWVGLGAAGGLAFGLGLGDGSRHLPRALAGGATGALIGTVLYEVAGTVLFPLDQTGLPVAAAAPPRLVAFALVNLLTAAGAAWAVVSARPSGEAATPVGG
jgi:hypothetical protein